MADGKATSKDDSAEKAFAAASEAATAPKPAPKAADQAPVAPAPDAVAFPPKARRAASASIADSNAKDEVIDAAPSLATALAATAVAKPARIEKTKAAAKPAKLAKRAGPTAKPPVAKAKPVASKPMPKPVAKTLPQLTDIAPAKSAPAAVQVKIPSQVSKPVAAKVPARSAQPVAAFKPASPTIPVHANSKIEDKIMSETTEYTEEMKAKLTEAQTKAKFAFEKGKVAMTDVGEFTKGNVEAMVESTRIFAAGMQDLGKTLVAEGKEAFEATTADVKTLAAVKSPTEFVKVQGDIARRNLDTMIATGSKNAESMMKVYSDAFAPISARFSLAMDKMKAAA